MSASAATPDAVELSYLETLVITGTREERRVTDTPIRTEVVSREELEKTHARDLREALENVPGLQLREVHGKSGYEVWLQGVSADRVLILVDGLPVIATTGSSVDVTQLSLLDVERVEVVKGATSAQYGSAAIGGVINVITRPVARGRGAALSLSGGSHLSQNPTGEAWDISQFNGHGSASAGGERVRWRVSGSHMHTDGTSPEPSSWERPGDEVTRSELSQQLEWLPTDALRLIARAGWYEESGESRYVFRRPGLSVNQYKLEDVTRLRGSLSGRYTPVGARHWHFDLLHEQLQNNTDKFSPTGVFDQRRAELGYSQAALRAEQSVGDRHRLMLGADYRRETLEQTKDGVSELNADSVWRDSRELWFQDTWMPGGYWHFMEWVAGGRAQWDSDFGFHFAPSVSLRMDMLKSDQLDIYSRLSWGQGYRVPNLKERRFEFDHSQLGYVVQGSPELEPERSNSYQAGLGLTLGRHAWAEANLFLNRINDLIQTDLDPAATAARNDGVQVYRFQNIDRAETRGLEASLGTRLAAGWQLMAAYTLTEARDRQTHEPLTRRPRHQVRLGLDGEMGVPGFSWSLRARQQSSELVSTESGARSPGYTAIDLKLNQDINRQLRLYGGVNNLTHQQRDFSDANDFGPVAGRFIYAGVRLLFGNQANKE
ncbi:MAG: TonB-dependent receptor [Marinobacter sp.]|nr:TonB-dependent receptor [Marinobacter sp.]